MLNLERKKFLISFELEFQIELEIAYNHHLQAGRRYS